MLEVVAIGHGHYCLFLDPHEELLVSNLASATKVTRQELLCKQIEIFFKVMNDNYQRSFSKPLEEP